MKEIVTVTGTIRPDELGFCQCHEHIAMRKGVSARLNPALCIDDYDRSLEEVKLFRRSGGDSFVEAQPCGCCRDALWLKDISAQSGVNIIASTGFHKMSFYPEDHWIKSISAAGLSEIFDRELNDGMFEDGDFAELPQKQTDVRAGLIKTAYDSEELTDRYKKLFRAAAMSAVRTGRCIMIHVELQTDPRPLQEYLLELGVPAQDLMFCHMDRACRDIAMHKAILQNGSYLEYDTIGRFKYHSDEYETEIFRSVADAGYEDRLLYSLDTTRSRLKAYDENAIGLDYILKVFNKELCNAGFSDEDIRKFSVENPRRFFAGPVR